MGTKNNPGQFDCYNAALPDEPRFALLARDPDFSRLVNEWASGRQRDVSYGYRPESDQKVINEARSCALDGALWRRANYGKWRRT